MIATFDIAEHADALAEMQQEQEAYAAELQAYRLRLAHALGLLDTAEKLRVLRVEAMTTAEGRLADAIGASVDAINAAEEAGRLVIEACQHVAAVRRMHP